MSKAGRIGFNIEEKNFPEVSLPTHLLRSQKADLPEVSELDVVRHYTNVSQKNFGVENGFYPLGSCTMKYNPKINDELATLPGFANIHPLQPVETIQGLLKIYYDLQHMLSEISGLKAYSLNPFAGAHGELAGLMIIKAYHEKNQDFKRNKIIIPDSAHGTNPASATVCGFETVEIKSNPDGTVNLEALKSLLPEKGEEVSAGAASIPETHRLEILKLQETIKTMLASNGRCFASYGGFSELGEEGGTSLIMEYDGNAGTTSFSVYGSAGGKQLVTDPNLHFSVENMAPCVIAGSSEVTSNFEQSFLNEKSWEEKIKIIEEEHYNPVNSITIRHDDGGYGGLSENRIDFGTGFKDFEDAGYLYTPDNKHICFFPTVDGGSDADGLDDDYLGEDPQGETSIPRQVAEGKLQRCS